MSELFRAEAVAHTSRRMSGSIVVVTPFPLVLIGSILTGIVLLAATFASLATYSRKATVAGWLVPDKGIVRTTARAPALVQRVYVKEGTVIEAGSRIADLELSGHSLIGNVGEAITQSLQNEANAVRAKVAAQRHRIEAERDRMLVKLSSMRSEITHAKLQVELQEERWRLARELSGTSESLMEKGALAKREFDARRSAAFSAQQELSALRRQVASLEREIDETDARISAVPIELAAIMAEGNAAEAALLQRLADAEAKRMQVVTAPISGRVAVVALTEGQAVAAGGLVAVLTPLDGKMEAELLVPSRAIGFVQKGQQVQLMLQAFPYERFGAVPATVRSVSTTVISATDVAIPGLTIQEPVFRVRVTPVRETLSAYGEPASLQPGMLLAADIILDRRTLIRWLFDPVFAAGQRS